LKVFHVLNHFLPFHTAGTEVYTFSLQHHLQQMGYAGGVIIPFFNHQNESEYVYNGIRVFGYHQDNIATDKVTKGLVPPSGMGEFGRLLDQLQPDVLHFHELSGSNGITIYHLKMAYERKIPIVFTMHLVGYVCASGTLMENNSLQCNGLIDIHRCTSCSFRHQQVPASLAGLYTYLSNCFRKAGISMYTKQGKIAGLLGRAERIQLYKERLHQMADYCNWIVTLNNWYANILVSNGLDSKKISVIPQGLPFVVTNNNTVDSLKLGAPLRLVFVGRIYPAKGLHVLLSALANLHPESFQLDIYGTLNDDAYLQQCEELADSNPSIQFCGTIPAGQTVSYLMKYHLLVLPSVVTEMAPLVIQEAFAAGIPVLASDVYGNKDSIQHLFNGLLFETGSSFDLYEKIKHLIKNPETLIALKKRVFSSRSFREVAHSYLEIYLTLVDYGKQHNK
jgi:glycosyltransferase involved in cell wall biosynthesis